MTLSSIGDLARGLTLQARGHHIKTEIETLSYELSSGRVQDISARLKGDYSHIADLERGLTRLDAYSVANSETKLLTDGMQISLTKIDDSVTALSTSLLAFGTSTQTVTHEHASVQARNELDTMISALNTRVGGRSLFSGTATDQTPLASADTLLNTLRSELTGLTTAADVRQAADNWFNDTTGFEAVIYQGSNTDLAPIRISDTEDITLAIRADDPEFRDALRDVAVAALATDPALPLSTDQRTALFKDIGVRLANSNDRNVALRAEVGAAQARIENAQSHNSAAQTSIEISRNELNGADPYDTAARLQTVQFQLESLYSVTVRNANLSLVNFLR